MSLRTPREQNNDLLYFYSCTLTNYLSLYSIYSLFFLLPNNIKVLPIVLGNYALSSLVF